MCTWNCNRKTHILFYEFMPGASNSKTTGYEHNFFIFSQFIWSWKPENMHNPRVNMNTIISRKNTFPLWLCFFCQPFGLIIIYLPTHKNNLSTLTIQARNDRGAVEHENRSISLLESNFWGLWYNLQEILCPLRITTVPLAVWQGRSCKILNFPLTWHQQRARAEAASCSF